MGLLVLLPLGADQRSITDEGVLQREPVRLALTAVPPECERMLVLAVEPQASSVTIADGGGCSQVGTLAVESVVRPGQGGPPGSNGPGVVALVEFYRRDGGWKLRALGRAYPGGAYDVQRLHGVRLTAPPDAATGADAASGGGTDPNGVGEIDGERAVDLVSMVLEDAARSASSYTSSVDFADRELEREESLIVADPALRVSAEGERKRQSAQARRDDLVRRALEVHEADLAKLRAEISALEQAFPQAMARWESMAPDGDLARPPAALRAGELTLARLRDNPDFRIPMVWRVPSRPC